MPHFRRLTEASGDRPAVDADGTGKRRDYPGRWRWLTPGAAAYARLAAFAKTSHDGLGGFRGRTREVHDGIEAVYRPGLMARDSYGVGDLRALAELRR